MAEQAACCPLLRIASCSAAEGAVLSRAEREEALVSWLSCMKFGPFIGQSGPSPARQDPKWLVAFVVQSPLISRLERRRAVSVPLGYECLVPRPSCAAR